MAGYTLERELAGYRELVGPETGRHIM